MLYLDCGVGKLRFALSQSASRCSILAIPWRRGHRSDQNGRLATSKTKWRRRNPTWREWSHNPAYYLWLRSRHWRAGRAFFTSSMPTFGYNELPRRQKNSASRCDQEKRLKCQNRWSSRSHLYYSSKYNTSFLTTGASHYFSSSMTNVHKPSMY